MCRLFWFLKLYRSDCSVYFDVSVESWSKNSAWAFSEFFENSSSWKLKSTLFLPRNLEIIILPIFSIHFYSRFFLKSWSQKLLWKFVPAPWTLVSLEESFRCLSSSVCLDSIDFNLKSHTILKIPFANRDQPLSVWQIFFKKWNLFTIWISTTSYASIKRNKSDIFTQPFFTKYLYSA